MLVGVVKSDKPRRDAVRCGALLKARRAPPDPTPQHAGSYVHAHKHNEEGASAARIRSYGCGVPFSSFFLLSPLPPLPLPRPALGAIGWLLPLQPDRPATALERARGFKSPPPQPQFPVAAAEKEARGAERRRGGEREGRNREGAHEGGEDGYRM